MPLCFLPKQGFLWVNCGGKFFCIQLLLSTTKAEEPTFGMATIALSHLHVKEVSSQMPSLS